MCPSNPIGSPDDRASGIALESAEALLDELTRLAAHEIDQSDYEEAEKILKRALEQDEHHPRCRAYMAICMAALGRGVRRAGELARSVTRDYPDDPGGWFALGSVELMAGRRGPAFQHFAHARRLSGREREFRTWIARLDPRRPPVIPALSRDHVLNRLLGHLRSLLERTR